jgi:hypothetical protein
MQTIGQGGTIRLDAIYSDGTGAAVDPTTPRLDIIDPVSTELVTDAVPVKDAVGLYHSDYAVAANAPLGLWRSHWTGVVNSVAVSGDDYFTVVAAGSIVFDPTDISGPDGAFATVAELQVRLTTTFTAAQILSAEQALLAATAVIRTSFNQTISAVSDDTETFSLARPYGSSFGYTDALFLSELPVTDVASVVLNGITLVADTDYAVDLDTGVLRRLNGWWDQWGLTNNVVVTYSHGYSPVPDDVKSVCLSAAARLYQGSLTPANVRSESVGGYYSVSYGDNAGAALTDGEMAVLESYRVLAVA